MKTLKSLSIALITTILLTSNTLRAAWLVAGNSKPIHDAVRNNDLALTQQLIAEDPSCVNAKENDDWTPLHWATIGDWIATAELLIDNGADINAKENDGWTPLHVAATNDHTAIAELLINHGADINAKTKIPPGLFPRSFVSSCDSTETHELIITLPPLNKMLWHAVCQNKVKLAKLALFKGASANALAAEWMLPKKMDTPIEAINCLRAAIERKDTPLHTAAKQENAEMVKLLLGFSGRINTPNNEGDTPFALAAYNADVLSAILEATLRLC